MAVSKWHFELWTPVGQFIADLRHRTKGRRLTQSRNEAEDIRWYLDLAEVERFARKLKIDPERLVIPKYTECRIRRGRKYLAGGQVTYVDPQVTASSARLEVRARGFLDLFIKRFTGQRDFYDSYQAAQMYVDMVMASQNKGPDWDFGVRPGPNQALVGLHDKTFKDANIKDAIQRGTELFNFDIEFTHDKKLNTYAALGSIRNDIIFRWPHNIKAIPHAPIDGTLIVNSVVVNGSGSGDDANIRTDPIEDVLSQHAFKVQEDRQQYSDVEDLTDLARHGQAQLDAYSSPFQIPELNVLGNVAPFVTDYGIGDYVQLETKQAPYAHLRALTGRYRAEQRTIDIDENDKEDVTMSMSL